MVQTLWYTDADQADLAREVVTNIRYMRSRQQGRQQPRSGGGDEAQPDNNDNEDNNNNDNDEEEEEGNFCARGLEHMLNSRTLEEQSRTKNAAIAAVLDEQRLQRLRARGRMAASGEVAHAHAYVPVCPTTLAVVAATAS